MSQQNGHHRHRGGHARRSKGARWCAAIALCLLAAACGRDNVNASTTNATPLSLAENLFSGGGESAQLQATLIEVGDLTTTCMAEAGFTWVAPPPPSGGMFAALGDESVARSPRALAETIGFGISTQWYPESELPSSLLGLKNATTKFVDPNIASVQEMSSTERAEYLTTLAGESLDGTSGCQGEAWLQASKSPTLVLYEHFGDDLAEATQQVLGDQRVAQASSKVAKCLGESGYGFYTLDEIEAYFESELLRIDELVETGADGSLTFEQAAIDGLGQLQEFELTMATTVADCRDLASYDDLVAAVSVEYLADALELVWGDVEQVLDLQNV